MLCDVNQLARDYNFEYSDKLERHIGELLSSRSLIPIVHRHSEGNEPGWDVECRGKDRTKIEIKIQSSEDLCIEIAKANADRSRGRACGVNTTEAEFYIMLNRINITGVWYGIIRVVLVTDILHYIEQHGGSKITYVISNPECVIFINPKDLPNTKDLMLVESPNPGVYTLDKNIVL